MQTTRSKVVINVLACMAAVVVALCVWTGTAFADTTYNTVANISTTTPMGTTAYVTNGNNPVEGTGTPESAVTENNATLTDLGNGTYKLVVSIPNPAFTLQSLGTCSNASVKATSTSTNIASYSGYTATVTSRISEVTILLTSQQDSYVFTDSSFYATPLLATAKASQAAFTADATLTVDFSVLSTDSSNSGSSTDSTGTSSDDTSSASGSVTFTFEDGSSVPAVDSDSATIVANSDGTYTISFALSTAGASLVNSISYNGTTLTADDSGMYSFTVSSLDNIQLIFDTLAGEKTVIVTATAPASSSSSDDDQSSTDDSDDTDADSDDSSTGSSSTDDDDDTDSSSEETELADTSDSATVASILSVIAVMVAGALLACRRRFS